MRDFVLPFCVFIFVLLFAGCAEGVVRVAVQQEMCNKASETPTSGKNIIEQIESLSFMEATYVQDADIDTAAELAAYDVVYMGPGGSDLEDNKLSVATANALLAWVNAGNGGVVFSALANKGFTIARSAIAPLMPVVQSDTVYWCKPTGTGGYPRIAASATTYSHFIFRNTTNNAWLMNAWSFFTPSGLASGTSSLAEIVKYSGTCCRDIDICGVDLTETTQGIAVKTYGSGRVAWFAAPYCGYDLYQPGNLRNSNDNLVFLNAIEWASGLCKAIGDCNGHGHCTGSNTCLCDSGWAGDATCTSPSCTQPCVHGTCTAPNVCTCYNAWYGTTCNDGCTSGWYGSNCSVRTYIRDDSFSEGAIKLHWNWHSASISSPIISANVGLCTAGGHTGSYRACFLSDDTAGTDYVQQGVYIIPNTTHPTFLSFWVRSAFAVGSTNKLYIKLDDVTIHTESISNVKPTYNQVVIDLSAYTTTAAEHIIRFEAVSTGGATGVFEVDDVKIIRGTCTPTCAHGHCDYVSESSSQCDCDTHYTGSTCSAAVCGDGYLVLGLEACDDHDVANGDGCSSTCTVEKGWRCTTPAEGITSTCTTVCGDGNVTAGHEACDDRNTVNGDGCSNTCTVELGWKCNGEPSVCLSECGDGIVASNEGCDDGGEVSGNGCSSTCQIETGFDCYGAPSICEGTVCPNSRRTRDEGCDDGNTDNDDGCNSLCQIEHGWECTGSAFSLSSCVEKCGNGMKTASEACDDGNTLDNDGCSADCLTQEPGWQCTGTDPTICVEVCGNSYITKSEECDDGGASIGCNASCKVIPGWHCLGSPKSTCAIDVCGNGALEPSEACDDNNSVNGDGCSSSCKKEAGWECIDVMYSKTVCSGVCGNGYRTLGEGCDDGNTKNNDGCNGTCVIEPGYECTDLPSHQSFCRKKCGNGVVLLPEECDDGNEVSADGCSSCKIDRGFACVGEPSNCTEICGDGLITYAKCDDNNTIANDGCTNCKIDKGFTCTGQPSVCHDKCGDGVISLWEECDDHNTVNGDGCSSTCKIETGSGTWRCVGEPSDCRRYGCPNNYVTPDEECDDGDTNENNGCTTSCKVMPGWDCGTNATQPSVCRFEVCGDGYTTKSEGCDDNNTVNGDCCNKTCGIEFGCSCNIDPVTKKSACGVRLVCGNGFTTYDESCDDGNTVSGDGCSSTCHIESGWVCETTNVRPTSCHLLQCGDGLTEGTEECDDGNLDSGDGCSDNCTIENGFTCKGTLCRNYCGNGVLLSSTEECDDGNRINGDGCNSTCGIEVGWNCANATGCTENCRSVCWSTCGDGRIASNEECDDGNIYIGDGCTHQCEIEPFWKCVGVPSVCIVKKCDLMITSFQVTHARCGGSNTGEIIITANGTGAVAYKLTGGGRELPPWEDAGRWINLGGATYTVLIILDGDENCKITQEVNVSQPSALSSGQLIITAPKACDSADGALAWSISGGTAPYMYSMGGKNSSTGVFTDLTNLDWDVVVATDSHQCQLATPINKIPPKQECEYEGFQKFLNDIWSRGGPAGLAIICVTAGVVVLGMIGYCIWDHHATSREEKEDAAADRAEAQSRAQQSEVELVPAVSTPQ